MNFGDENVCFENSKGVCFTLDEITAVCKLAYMIAKVDGEVAEQETRVTVMALNDFNLSQIDRIKILAKSSVLEKEDVRCTISLMSYKQKHYVSSLLVTTLFADGRVNENEVKLINAFTSMYDLPEVSNAEAILTITNMSLPEFASKVILK